ncbi:MAG: hypothetical protein LRZ90_04180 [Thermodesulfovibrionales bacterium]|nr:hypothetical protein [Thermodesulfovibrionales bacterium]
MVVAIHAFGRKEHNSMLLDMSEYQRIIEELEEVESIRAYDAAKTSKDEVIPFEQAVNEIEQGQK